MQYPSSFPFLLNGFVILNFIRFVIYYTKIHIAIAVAGILSPLYISINRKNSHSAVVIFLKEKRTQLKKERYLHFLLYAHRPHLLP